MATSLHSGGQWVMGLYTTCAYYITHDSYISAAVAFTINLETHKVIHVNLKFSSQGMDAQNISKCRFIILKASVLGSSSQIFWTVVSDF